MPPAQPNKATADLTNNRRDQQSVILISKSGLGKLSSTMFNEENPRGSYNLKAS